MIRKIERKIEKKEKKKMRENEEKFVVKIVGLKIVVKIVGFLWLKLQEIKSSNLVIVVCFFNRFKWSVHEYFEI